MKGLMLNIFLIAIFFLSLVFYNYYQAQKSLGDTKESILNISLINAPTTAKVGSPVKFEWQINAPGEFRASTTTIFYDFVSSPSALRKSDSPQSAGYHFSTSDYARGFFYLPDYFKSNIVFPKVGKIWFRGYASVRGDHLWTDEYVLNIIP